MSYFLLADSKNSIAGSTTPLIKKAELEAFVDAAALFRRANIIAADADSSNEAARQQAVETGYAAGLTTAQVELDEAVRGFADAIARIEEHHAGQVADAAHAAVVAIIGKLEDHELVGRLVSKVLAGQKERNGLSVHVAPGLLPKLEGMLGDLPIVANSELGPAECHIMTANGRIIASLPVQLAVLRERWGLGKAEGNE